MRRLLLGVAVLPFLSGMTFAAQELSDRQMDKVTAGFDFSVIERTNYTTTIIDINQPDTVVCAACYLDVSAGFVHVRSAFGGNVPLPPVPPPAP